MTVLNLQVDCYQSKKAYATTVAEKLCQTIREWIKQVYVPAVPVF
jgi:hypothetical protein